MTPKDRTDLEAALVTGVDWIALFFRSCSAPRDVVEAKKLIPRPRCGDGQDRKSRRRSIALPEIIEACDGADGRPAAILGVELPLETGAEACRSK